MSVALMALFTTATTVALASATATSTDNRARVGASALAQRELEYVSQAITQGAGSSALRDEGTVENPHVAEELDTGANQEYRFAIDGERYKVVRTAEPWETTTGSACEADTISEKTVYGTLVTVTVTWDGMGDLTKPHVASQIFPPKRDETLGVDPSKGVVAIGVKDSTGAPLGGIQVRLTGGGGPWTKTTNAKGCVAFEVTPDQDGSEYQATLLGDGKSAWVNPTGQPNPAITVTVQPGKSQAQWFEDGYDRAASLKVRAINAASHAVEYVQIEPPSDTGGGTRLAKVEGEFAQFDNVYPGVYYLTVLGVEDLLPPVRVELDPGAKPEITLEIP